jgi:adenosylhomocysteine nucleosidase
MVHKLGILGAMPPEIALLREHTTDHVEHQYGIFSFTEAKLGERPVVFASSHVGASYSASVVTTMIVKVWRNYEIILF